MKFNPEKLTWKAIHDKKIIDYPNYIDIDRSTLKEFQLRDENGKVVFSLKNPKKLFARLRTYKLRPSTDENLKVWIVGNSNPLEFYIIDGEETTKYDVWGNDVITAPVIFREDEK